MKSASQPKTIAELQEWFKANGYDYYKTRFFIGINYQDPKAFGIYQNDAGDFVVYKNKANGERAIRYQGPDEEHAVNEIWKRFLQEIDNQKKHWQENKRKNNAGTKTGIHIPKNDELSENARQMRNLFLIILVTFMGGLFISVMIMDIIPAILRVPVVIGLGFISPILASNAYIRHINGNKNKDGMDSDFKQLMKFLLIFLAITSVIGGIGSFAGRKNGYYSRNGELYYRAGSNWYVYSNEKEYWYPEFIVPSDFTSSNWRDYKNTNGFENTYRSFESTSYYDDWKSDDTGGDWSPNDWDSGYTDWNSDW